MFVDESSLILLDHERLSSVLSIVSALPPGSTRGMRNLADELRGMERSPVIMSDSAVYGLYRRLAQLLGSVSARPLSRDELRDIRELSEEIRLRMVAVSLTMGLGVSSMERLLHRASANSCSWADAITLGHGGLTYASFDGLTVILFSPVHSVEQCHDILAEMANIYDRTYLSCDWIFDFSAVQHLPVILLGSLLSYERQLHAAGRRLQLCWVRPTLLPEPSIERLIQLFNLVKIGGFYFSRPSPEL